MPSGIPAFAWVQIVSQPTVGLVVTINGDTYTYGTDFVGLSAAQALRSLVEAINADQNNANEVNPANTNFFRQYCAVMSGNYAVLYARVPGAGGNSLTLATSNAGQAVISSATFAGGVNGSAATAGGGALLDGSGTITAGGAAQQIFAARPNRIYLFVQNLSAHNLYVNLGAVATGGAGSIILVPNGSIVYENAFVPNGLVSIYGATTADPFTAKQA